MRPDLATLPVEKLSVELFRKTVRSGSGDQIERRGRSGCNTGRPLIGGEPGVIFVAAVVVVADIVDIPSFLSSSSMHFHHLWDLCRCRYKFNLEVMKSMKPVSSAAHASESCAEHIHPGMLFGCVDFGRRYSIMSSSHRLRGLARCRTAHRLSSNSGSHSEASLLHRSSLWFATLPAHRHCLCKHRVVHFCMLCCVIWTSAIRVHRRMKSCQGSKFSSGGIIKVLMSRFAPLAVMVSMEELFPSVSVLVVCIRRRGVFITSLSIRRCVALLLHIISFGLLRFRKESSPSLCHQKA